jgi:ATP-dependent RNA helicase RhlE
VVFGGVGINPQIDALQRGCDILVATPGRLLDLYQQKIVGFSALEILVLDEADRMLDMGFIRDIRKILQLLPKQRQNLLFSATFSDDIRALAKTICHSPLEIDVAPRNSTVETVEQQVYEVQKDKKLPLLGKLLLETREQVLVFSRTKHGANALVKKLAGFGVDAAAIHGNKSQNQRTKALDDFKNNRVQVLVATDIAARGLDIDLLAMVVNYDLPQVPEDYVHRIGRTGRAGASGLAVSLVCDEDSDQLRAIERLIRRKINRMSFDAQSLPVPKAVPEPARPSEQSTKGQQGRQRPARPRHPGGQRSAPAYPRQDSAGQRPAQQPPRQHSSRQPDLRQHGAGFGASASGLPQSGGRSQQGVGGGHGGRRRGRGHGGGRPQMGGSANPGNELRQGPAPGNRAPRPQAAVEQQPKRPVSGNREGASFGLPAKAASDSLWRSLGDRLRQGKLFRR